ncbi:transposase [Lactobacillus sp. UMNPBX16]|nr:transposase [Lactobacillus crispatus]OXC42593.1 transposase [Lactobacillus crispatus]PEG82452.1 transposase [Lactobacillus sp. UMNPBX16]PEG98384.1 transposase [Lactobacillus sp. UMNPBX8]
MKIRMTRIVTRTYRLYPDKTMKIVLDQLCDYRRCCWNQALELWNDLYDDRRILPFYAYRFVPNKNGIKEEKINLKTMPNWRLVRNMMVEQKQDWQYQYSAHLLQLAVQDLGKAWQAFFDKSQARQGNPGFKSKKLPKQGFKSDQAKLKDGLLYLEKSREYKGEWHPIKFKGRILSDKFGVLSITRKNDKYYLSIPFKVEDAKPWPKSGKYTAVDVNVGHFNYTEGKQLVLPKSLTKSYKKIAFYQRMLAKKRTVNGLIKGTQSNRYAKARAKLQREYEKCANIQKDLMHKFTIKLVKDYDKIVIEELSVKDMLMSHAASKGVHRSMFGTFRQLLAYKCEWYGKELIVANKLYPSTQRCANCGFVKKGDEKITLQGNQKHGTKHNEYVCYKCGYKNDRDQNAVKNLYALIEHPELNKAA